MPPEEKELLNKSVELGEENNKMLRDMRRSQRISRIISIVYWVFIIGSAVGAYYFIQPYVDQLSSMYGGAKSNFDSVNNFLKNLKK